MTDRPYIGAGAYRFGFAVWIGRYQINVSPWPLPRERWTWWEYEKSTYRHRAIPRRKLTIGPIYFTQWERNAL